MQTSDILQFNYFTDFNLSQTLLDKGITLVGIVKKSKTFIPPEFQPNRSRPINSSLFGFTKSSILVSYVPKKSKAVILLSTMHHSADVVVEEASKPEIIFY